MPDVHPIPTLERFEWMNDGVLQEDPSIWRIDDKGKLHISAHEGQMKVLNSKARKIGAIAGNQSGKTSIGPIWLYLEIKKRGPGEYGVVSPTFALMNLKTLPEFKRFFGKEGMNLGHYIDSRKEFVFSRRGLRKTFGTDRYASGKIASVVVRFGYAENPDSLESMTLKGLWCDESGQEAFKLASFQVLNRRTGRFGGRQLHTTTPYNLGALKTQLWDRWKNGDPLIEIINFESIMNPYFPLEEWEYQREIMPAWKFDLFYRGIFTAPAGLIYDNLRDHHKVKRFSIPQDWIRIWGVDFGQVNTACVKMAINPHWKKTPRGEPINMHPHARRIYIYGTYKSGSKTVEKHIESLFSTERQGIKPIVYGGSNSEDAWRDKFAANGLFIHSPSLHGVEEGIDSVFSKLATGELAYFDDLEELDKEFRTYSRKLDKNEQPTMDIADKNTFHRLDGLRYPISEMVYNPNILTGSYEPTYLGVEEDGQ